jgi:1,4-dihydroxy-2-naphthoyl-CoA hydrolase
MSASTVPGVMAACASTPSPVTVPSLWAETGFPSSSLPGRRRGRPPGDLLTLFDGDFDDGCHACGVRDAVRQPIGLVHGGVYASISEALTSLATGAGVGSEGLIATRMSNQTNFLRPITDGVIHAEAVRRHRGRTSWMWDVAITDDEGRLCAVSRMTIAVRPPHR